MWWRELQVLVLAYSGLRWGEMAALTADRVDPTRRCIVVDRQVVETRHELSLGPPKNRRRRTTMYRPVPPKGSTWPPWSSVDWPGSAERSWCSPRPGATGPGAPTTGATPSLRRPPPPAGHRPGGTRSGPFHSLRHVFATWALAQPGARIEDVSRLLGHSTVRVTQDLYISPDGDLFERFYRATA